MKKSFILYNDQKELFNKLSASQVKELMMKVFEYSETYEPNSIKDPVVDMAFTAIKTTMDRDAEKYKETCKKNAENIQKRWNKSNTAV